MKGHLDKVLNWFLLFSYNSITLENKMQMVSKTEITNSVDGTNYHSIYIYIYIFFFFFFK